MTTIPSGYGFSQQFEDMDLPGELAEMTPADLEAWLAWNRRLDLEWEAARRGGREEANGER